MHHRLKTTGCVANVTVNVAAARNFHFLKTPDPPLGLIALFALLSSPLVVDWSIEQRMMELVLIKIKALDKPTKSAVS